MTTIDELRLKFHKDLWRDILFVTSDGIPNIADKGSKASVKIAKGIVDRINQPCRQDAPSGQEIGSLFEKNVSVFLEKSFSLLQHICPGKFCFSIGTKVAEFEQYEHLAEFSRFLVEHKELRSSFGDYIVKPDIVIGRYPLTEDEINPTNIVSENIARFSPMREINNTKLLLHASISCKWTLRSDRSQNARTEGLNLIRNRKGFTPHIVIVTAEPLPTRLSSIAQGTGDIDCVYHIALKEMIAAIEEIDDETLSETLDILVSGKRLRDISDLPLDLVS
jgi:hypothetical protein